MNAAAPGSGSVTSAPRDVREIESEIQVTRAELDRTLDALQERLSPRRRLRAALDVAKRRSGMVYDRGGALAREAYGLARREPFPLVVVGIALVAAITAVTARRRH
jgi:polysaccharide deacetylase 2 family uncharacterized protein YibQ